MPRPLNERQSLEQERGELLAQMTAYWKGIENGSPRQARREFLEWQVRQAVNRLAAIRARLAAIKAERG
jgi:hypothetical protein